MIDLPVDPLYVGPDDQPRGRSLLDGAVTGVGLWVCATGAVVAALLVVLALLRARR